jgi:hypothetical protein
MQDDWSNQFNSLLSSPLGQELLRTLREDLHQSIIDSAESAKTQETAFGLLKEARGVIRCIEHLQFRSVVSKDEGGKKN